MDSVSVMVMRDGLDPDPLIETRIEVGLHLELPEEMTNGQAAVAAFGEQLTRFEAALGRPAAYLDGHRHCHARSGLATAMAREARRLGLPVRSVDAAHRRILRREGVATPDRLVGRYSEEPDAALPVELRDIAEGVGVLPPGLTEWMVHPGHPDPASGSTYDHAREEDLDLVLSLSLEPALRSARLTHAAAFE